MASRGEHVRNQVPVWGYFSEERKWDTFRDFQLKDVIIKLSKVSPMFWKEILSAYLESKVEYVYLPKITYMQEFEFVGSRDGISFFPICCTHNSRCWCFSVATSSSLAIWFLLRYHNLISLLCIWIMIRSLNTHHLLVSTENALLRLTCLRAPFAFHFLPPMLNGTTMIVICYILISRNHTAGFVFQPLESPWKNESIYDEVKSTGNDHVVMCS